MSVCALKTQCCPLGRVRPHEDREELVAQARKRVEMRFAHLKIHHGFERMRLRGLSGARDEFHLAAIVQNLKTLALELSGRLPINRAQLSLSETYTRTYWWCSPPKIGRASVWPIAWMARGIGASFSSDRCVRVSL
jgi:Transposase DDE domain